VSTRSKGSLELVGEFLEVRTQVDRGLTIVSRVDRRLGLIENLGRHKAWKFWVAYGGCTGFDVRKRYANKSNYDGKVTSCRFVCSNEGHRRKV
jgi:hypothetical protein